MKQKRYFISGFLFASFLIYFIWSNILFCIAKDVTRHGQAWLFLVFSVIFIIIYLIYKNNVGWHEAEKGVDDFYTQTMFFYQCPVCLLLLSLEKYDKYNEETKCKCGGKLGSFIKKEMWK